ncbi:hypothetical protein SAMN05216344_112106 [Polaromonas sp. OV174]|uniref:hypothetical protein n=1 Tax=Polaromonas sp. OV174 TaxID=1855300 RepID=UPI0008F453B0|nr:hypothetical protein [Polaromonas sp. OV174]SFC26058.1 hypothetical protein SAMN05216344_112106 [Polaromonas sp. OV174]
MASVHTLETIGALSRSVNTTNEQVAWLHGEIERPGLHPESVIKDVDIPVDRPQEFLSVR